MNVTFSTPFTPVLNHLKEQLFTSLQRKVALITLAIFSAIAAVYFLSCCCGNRFERVKEEPKIDPKALLSSLLEATKKQVFVELGGEEGIEKIEGLKFYLDVEIGDKKIFSKDVICNSSLQILDGYFGNSFAVMFVPLSEDDEATLANNPDKLVIHWLTLSKGKDGLFYQIFGSQSKSGNNAEKSSFEERYVTRNLHLFLEETHREIKPQYDGKQFV